MHQLKRRTSAGRVSESSTRPRILVGSEGGRLGSVVDDVSDSVVVADAVTVPPTAYLVVTKGVGQAVALGSRELTVVHGYA